MNGWIGVDLDGTLAEHCSHKDGIGKPVPLMVKRVLDLIARGGYVKIFTARAGDISQVILIRQWLKDNGLPELEITNIKDFQMIEYWDDRARQVDLNTGEFSIERIMRQIGKMGEE